jgi:hypothetical protein
VDVGVSEPGAEEHLSLHDVRASRKSLGGREGEN